jgi:hypothetical protein
VWTDSWLSIASADCSLIGVGAGEKQVRKVYAGGPLSVEQTSRLGSRDLVASGIKCELHVGKNSKLKSWMNSWWSLKTMVEPRRRRDQVMSGDWREATPSPRGFSGSPKNH